jgi:hypothetical protein
MRHVSVRSRGGESFQRQTALRVKLNRVTSEGAAEPAYDKLRIVRLSNRVTLSAFVHNATLPVFEKV